MHVSLSIASDSISRIDHYDHTINTLGAKHEVCFIGVISFIPTGLYSDRSMFGQVDIPIGRYSDRSLFRQVLEVMRISLFIIYNINTQSSFTSMKLTRDRGLDLWCPDSCFAVSKSKISLKSRFFASPFRSFTLSLFRSLAVSHRPFVVLQCRCFAVSLFRFTLSHRPFAVSLFPVSLSRIAISLFRITVSYYRCFALLSFRCFVFSLFRSFVVSHFRTFVVS